MSSKLKIVKQWKLQTVPDHKKIMDDINLSEDSMEKILGYLTYEDTLPMRLVSRSFNKVISNKFNKDFENLGDKIDTALNNTSKILKKGSLEHNTIRYFKILYYLRAEYNVIRVVMQKYLKKTSISFTGGSILDSFNKILSSDCKEEREGSEYMKIFHLVEVYLNNFCMEVDELLQKEMKDTKSSKECFGLKVIDILDCGIELGRSIQYSQGPDCIYLEGEYHGKDVNLFEDLPDMNKQYMTESEVKSFVQMVRNNIRWGNLLFCIQQETSKLALDYFTPVQKITSHTSLRLRKDTFKVLNEREKDLLYMVTLKCSRDDLPPKIVRMLKDNLSSNVHDWTSHRKSNTDNPTEFNMLIKMRTKTEDGSVNEKVVKLYHVGDEFVSSEFSKVVSALR